MEYWVPSSSIWLKNSMVYGLNKPWTVKTSTEDLKNSEYGKMLLPFMSWPVRYLPTFHKKCGLRQTPKALIQPLKLCVFDHYSMIPTFHHSILAA